MEKHTGAIKLELSKTDSALKVYMEKNDKRISELEVKFAALPSPDALQRFKDRITAVEKSSSQTSSQQVTSFYRSVFGEAPEERQFCDRWFVD